MAGDLKGVRTAAVWAAPTLETAVAVTAALLAGVVVVPLNPKSGERELGHILGDSAPDVLLAAPGTALPDAPAALPRVDVDPARGPARAPCPTTGSATRRTRP